MLRTTLLVLIAGYLFAAIIGLHEYINLLSLNWILGIVALIATIGIRKSMYESYRYLFAGLVFAMLYVAMPAKTLLYAAIALSLCFLTETFYGKLNRLVIICLVLMSPIFEYLTGIFSFPVRLFLTRLAGRVLASVEPGARAEGNLIYYHNEGFSVDPACMGLQMLVASMLASVILLSMAERKAGVKISWIYLSVYFSGIFLLNLVCNIFRIISLVLFHIESGTMMHELVGLVCFSVYVLMPAHYLAIKFVKAFGRDHEAPYSKVEPVIPQFNSLMMRDKSMISQFKSKFQHLQSTPPQNQLAFPHDKSESSKIESFLGTPVKVLQAPTNSKILKMLLLNSGLLLVIFSVIGFSSHRGVNDRTKLLPVSMDGYQITNLADKITKLQSASELIYIKPIAGFYSSDHQPMICWKGSGFEFQHVKAQTFDGHEIYTAILQRGQERLHTAWWYYDGTRITNSQLSWRWSAIKNKTSCVLINITTADAAVLENAVKKIIAAAPFKGMFAHEQKALH